MVSFPEILRRSGAHSLVWRRLLCSGIPQCRFHYIRNKVCPCILMIFQWLMTRAPSLIGSTQLFVVFSLGLIGGRIFDTGYWFVHMSSRHIGKTELIAIIARSAALPCSCCASSCFRCRIRSSSTSSVAGHEYLFSHILNHCLTQVFLGRVGPASGITYVPSYGVIPQYFRRQRALAMGIGSSVSLPLNNNLKTIYRTWVMK